MLAPIVGLFVTACNGEKRAKPYIMLRESDALVVTICRETADYNEVLGPKPALLCSNRRTAEQLCRYSAALDHPEQDQRAIVWSVGCLFSMREW